VIFRAFVLVAVLGLGACSFRVGEPPKKQVLTNPGDPAESAEAVRAAEAMLHLVDEGKADATWSLTGDYIHQTANETAWVGTIKFMRGTSGPLRKRSLVGARFTPTIENAPPGHYFGVFYTTEFANLTAEEKVILNLEHGKWMVVGYFMSSKFQAKL
jgi:hypothetical protein